MNVDPQVRYFLDTNIPVYAYDRFDGERTFSTHHLVLLRLFENRFVW